MTTFSLSDVPAVSDALGRKSGRRDHLVTVLCELAYDLRGDRPDAERLRDIFDTLHASVCIVDDLLDNEKFRAERPSYYARHGKDTASIAALHLLISSCKKLSKLGVDSELALTHIENMIFSEEADVGLLSRTKEYSYFGWYQKVTSQKTAHELLLIFDAAIADTRKNIHPQALKDTHDIITQLGAILQMTNDWRDMFAMKPMYRTGLSDEYMFTYSLPLAIYCEQVDGDMMRLVGKRYPKKDAAPYLALITDENIRLGSEKYITSTLQDLQAKVKESSNDALSKLLAIANAAVSGEFWKEVTKNVA